MLATRRRPEAEPENPKDLRFTPRKLILELHAQHRFTVDAASDPSTPAAQVIGRIWTREDDGLAQSWRGERVFCNPPFSDLPAWVAKAHAESGWADLIVMLMPAVRTEQPFWQQYVEPFRDRADSGVTTRFLSARTRFGNPLDPEGENVGQPEFGCVLVTWLQRCAKSAAKWGSKPASDERAGVMYPKAAKRLADAAYRYGWVLNQKERAK